jgi:drug/metabolite transporter (DMT)-like permease
MPPISLGERLVSAILGVLFGAVIGAILVWLLGVYSHSLPTSPTALDVRYWIAMPAIAFGLVGLIFGSAVGTVIGTVFSALFESEQERGSTPVTWVVAGVLFLAGAWWIFRG